MKLILLALLPLLTLADTVKDREGAVRSDREELSPLLDNFVSLRLIDTNSLDLSRSLPRQ